MGHDLTGLPLVAGLRARRDVAREAGAGRRRAFDRRAFTSIARGPRLGARRLGLDGKRVFDLVLALCLLAALLPLLLGIAAAVRLDTRGPVLFRQRRTGANGRVFPMLKFRSMRVLEDGAVIRQARAGDERITRVGRILRRTSLDELPQLWNVVRGEMSLVGPRPHAVAHDELYERLIPGYAGRFRVRPGITGLAQVSGLRGETPTLESMARRVAQDLDYVRRQSFALDLKILARTIGALKGA